MFQQADLTKHGPLSHIQVLDTNRSTCTLACDCGYNFSGKMRASKRCKEVGYVRNEPGKRSVSRPLKA